MALTMEDEFKNETEGGHGNLFMLNLASDILGTHVHACIADDVYDDQRPSDIGTFLPFSEIDAIRRRPTGSRAFRISTGLGEMSPTSL